MNAPAAARPRREQDPLHREEGGPVTPENSLDRLGKGLTDRPALQPPSRGGDTDRVFEVHGDPHFTQHAEHGHAGLATAVRDQEPLQKRP